MIEEEKRFHLRLHEVGTAVASGAVVAFAAWGYFAGGIPPILSIKMVLFGTGLGLSGVWMVMNREYNEWKESLR